ncbi:MAG: hypothetical protein A4E19_16790 [Nitrospira sp. SG-bin1]|nr:MAG: hypothetical protein A4E19_16790 [Nitrospira sp. SG-bin1]
MKGFMLGLLSGLLFWPVDGFTELYKWTDDQGNFHITDTPPPMVQKKHATTAIPAPRSASPKKTRIRPILPGQSRAEVHPIPDPAIPSLAGEERSRQQAVEGLSPSQATQTSSWQVFERIQLNTKAAVRRWQDEQGLDHFADVLPVAPGRPEATPQSENVSVSASQRRANERVTGVSRSRHSPTE